MAYILAVSKTQGFLDYMLLPASWVYTQLRSAVDFVPALTESTQKNKTDPLGSAFKHTADMEKDPRKDRKERVQLHNVVIILLVHNKDSIAQRT